ncbi:MAG TPA: WecB/TagA/CpsF family glycosyltransferase [Acetivibrio sp.]|jgi:N-acetylglucosaminyldiphosphoundecaprenol N-acetyl-beta-D-mannosaminyltransferase|nr:WecB/TagA/CpsF family glycosyltransferase [Clostridium sp.]HOQ36902.1 WecB/TagA/CpsF family glycosyltransferase [Acetivibrio sp.]HPT91231.1 WecB/TagA/CpsF family glycosyltransferase [Acetivibrio sp.]HQA56385.1 WecB/TagA/CpsF family glycosyltransferase [Acetivibrio sp.]
MRNTADILGIPVDNVSMDEALSKVKNFLGENRFHSVYTPNSEIMMAARRDPELKKLLCEADLLVPDGAGVVLASKILGRPLKERVAGFDLTNRLFDIAKESKTSFFFFGGKPGVAEEAVNNLLSRNINIEVKGIRNGYFSEDEEDEIINQINSSGADVLLVALGAPKQEKWIHKNRDKLKVKVCIGVGGTFDVLAGRATRAPKFFQEHGLEWLYRLYKEPWRFIRMMDLPRFILLVTAVRIGLKKA